MAAPIDTPPMQGQTPAPTAPRYAAPSSLSPDLQGQGQYQVPPELLDLLTHVIHQKLNEPVPQPPRAPGAQPLGPAQAITASLHPETAPFFQQQAMQGPQALFEQQMEQYKNQVAGRSGAMQALSGLAQHQLEAQTMLARLSKPALKEHIDARGHLIRDMVDPWSGQTQTTVDRGSAQVGYQWKLNPDTGFFEAMPTKGPPIPTGTGAGPGGTAPSGRPQGVPGKPNDAVLGDIRAVLDLEQTMKQMKAAYEGGHKETGTLAGMQRGFAKRLAGHEATSDIAAVLDPNARNFEDYKAKAKLQLNKSVSGQSRLLQADITQLGQYLGNYSDPDNVMTPRFDNINTGIAHMKDILRTAHPLEWQKATASADVPATSNADRIRALIEGVKAEKRKP